MPARTISLFLLTAVLSSCRSSASQAGSGPRAAAPDSAAATSASVEKRGVLAPLDGAVLSLWPEEYAGSWLVLEVLPQGTRTIASCVALDAPRG